MKWMICDMLLSGCVWTLLSHYQSFVVKSIHCSYHNQLQLRKQNSNNYIKETIKDFAINSVA